MFKCRDCGRTVVLVEVYRRFKDGTVRCGNCAFESREMSTRRR